MTGGVARIRAAAAACQRSALWRQYNPALRRAIAAVRLVESSQAPIVITGRNFHHAPSIRLFDRRRAARRVRRDLAPPAAGGSPAPTPAPAPAPAPTPAASSAQAGVDRDAAIAEQEAALAKRESDLALREREQAVAQREAEMAAKEAAAAQSKAKAASAKRLAAKARVASTAKQANDSAASSGAGPAAAPLPPLVIPAGTQFAAALTAALSTKTARVGDPVEARVADDLMIDGRRAIAAGALVHGKVTNVISGSHKIGGAAALGVRFDGLELQSGKVATINSSLTQAAKSETAKDTAKILGGALAGAVLGKQVGDARGRLIGGVLGGAAGAVVAEKTGNEVELPPGTTVNLVLDAPLTVGRD